MSVQKVPESDADLWAPETLRNPHAVYRELRELGPVVRLVRHDLLAITTYAELRLALADWRAFSSVGAVGVDRDFNQGEITNITNTDPPEHTALRAPLSAPSCPTARWTTTRP